MTVGNLLSRLLAEKEAEQRAEIDRLRARLKAVEAAGERLAELLDRYSATAGIGTKAQWDELDRALANWQALQSGERQETT